MWSRFPPRMRGLVIGALHEAGRRGCEAASAGHLALAIAQDGNSAAAFMFERAGVSPPAVADAVEQRVEPVTHPTGGTPARSLSADALHLLDVAKGEADRAGDAHVSTEHVALAIARLPHTPVGQAVADAGFTPDKAQAAFDQWRAQSKRGPRGSRWVVTGARRRRRLALPARLAVLVHLPRIGWNVLVRKSVVHPGFVANPYPLYRWLRERDPVRKDPLAPVWVVTRYTDVMTVIRDGRFRKDPFAMQRLPRVAREQLGVPPEEQARSSAEATSMLFLDPPDHTRVRGVFAKTFTPRSIERLRARIQLVTDKRLDRMATAGGGDLIAELAYPLPVIVIAELLGFPPEDFPKLKQWSDDMAGALALRPTVEQQIKAAAAREEMRVYFDGVVATLRARPGDNLLSALLDLTSGPGGDDRLSPEELFANCVLLLAAGHETTTNLIGNGMLALLRNPDQLANLRADPTLIDSAVDELLRYDAPVQWVTRVAGEDIPLTGGTLPAGAVVLASIGSGNRDPAQFTAPDRLDLRRPDNKHLSFGSGIHFCLGAALARMEGTIAIGSLVARLPTLRLDNHRPRWRGGVIFRGLHSLPVST